MIKEQLDLIMVALVLMSITMYDVVFDLAFSILHLVFEFLHVLFEWFELGIEHVVEHLFHTTRHGSQVITFYILMMIAGLLIYWLWRITPRYGRQFLKFAQYKVLQCWKLRKNQCKAYWLSLTLINKVRLISTATGIAYLTSFFVT